MMTTVSNDWLRLYPQLATANSAMLSPDNRGLAYGDGFFTTMGVIDGEILWQNYHQQRLISHAQALQLQIDSQGIMMRLQASAQQLQQGMMKLIVTRAPQAVRGYGFSADESGSHCEIWLKVSAMALATSEDLCLPNGHSILVQSAKSASCLTAQIACLPPTLAGLKSLNRIDNVLASSELQALKTAHLANNTELGEGLLRDMTGNWVEGTMSNVFYQLADEDQPGCQQSSSSSNITSQNTVHNTNLSKDYLLNGQWFTPPMTQSGVAGVMRQVIIDSLAKTEHPVQIRVLTDDDLANMSQMFFCNALRGIMPVSELRLPAGDKVCFSV